MDTNPSLEMQAVWQVGFGFCRGFVKGSRWQNRHAGYCEELRLPMGGNMLEEICLAKPASNPGPEPLDEDTRGARVIFDALTVRDGVPAIDPCGRLVREPEPFGVIVVRSRVLELGLSSLQLLLCWAGVLAQGRRNIRELQRRDGEADGDLLGLQNGVDHAVQLERDVRHHSEQAKAARGRSQLLGIRDSLCDPVCIDIFDGTHLIAHCAEAAASTMAERTVESAHCDPVYLCQFDV